MLELFASVHLASRLNHLLPDFHAFMHKQTFDENVLRERVDSLLATEFIKSNLVHCVELHLASLERHDSQHLLNLTLLLKCGEQALDALRLCATSLQSVGLKKVFQLAVGLC